ncbi:MAG: hypothetical protein EAZ55_14030, partial [Cytophagales bacterium]
MQRLSKIWKYGLTHIVLYLLRDLVWKRCWRILAKSERGENKKILDGGLFKILLKLLHIYPLYLNPRGVQV